MNQINRRARPILANMLWEDTARGGVSAAIMMSQRDRLPDQIRHLALRGMGDRQTDGQLLELFISERDESAFALLLRRHGAMVWSVCRRVLGNAHDADDAFQAAFLVLVRKADSIRPRESVGNWLYGVAYRTALEARRRIARRKAKEQSLHDAPPPESKSEEPWHELWPILDRELSRLPDKYRLPIVLCDLEGRSRKDVARQLAIPEGTLSSRLNTARKKLAARLARYGFTISVAALGILLTEKAATASLSLSLLSSTTKAALGIAASPAAAGIVSATVSTLTEGVLKTMFIAKIKTATLVLCSVAVLGAGTGGVYYQTRVGAAGSPQSDRVVQDNRKKTTQPGEREIDKLKRQMIELTKAIAEARDEKTVQRIEMRELQAEARRKGAEIVELERTLAFERKVAKEAKQEAEELRRKIESTRRETTERQQRSQVPLAPNPRLEKLKEMRKVLEGNLNQLEEGRAKLEEIYKTDMEATRKELAKVDAEIKSIMAQQAANSRPGQKQSGTDKLDQILQRLERLEKRLDRLEGIKP